MLAIAHVLLTEGLVDRELRRPHWRSAASASRPTCSGRPTGSRRRPSGRPRSPAYRPRRFGPRPRDGRRADARHGQPVDPARRVRRAAGLDGGRARGAARARSAFPAAASASARRRWRHGQPRASPCRCRPSRRAATRSRRSFRLPGSRTCCWAPASRSTTTAARYTYPDIRLVYWAGGNPFHHHQDLTGCARPSRGPTRSIVHDGTGPRARHADIVLPATITLERDDIGAAGWDAHLVAMHRVVEPFEEARDDYAILTGLARGSGARRPSPRAGRRRLAARAVRADAHARPPASAATCRRSTSSGQRRGRPATDGPTDARRGVPSRPGRGTAAHAQRPGRAVLREIASFRDPDVPGHPAWREPVEWHAGALAARFPLVLIANQPARRLHSQLDFGAHSLDGKLGGREPADQPRRCSGARDRGWRRCARLQRPRRLLAAAVLSDAVMPGVVQLPTGAWYTPALVDGRVTCVHGNPNAVTSDRGTSSLAQGSTGQHCLVEVERFDGPIPALDPYAPPPLA